MSLVMRNVGALVGAAALLLLGAGCSSASASLQRNPTATMLHMADPRANKQLDAGFYPFFGGGRWTSAAFNATLQPPPSASKKGALLVLRFGLPESAIATVRSIQVSASVAGVALQPQTYDKAGDLFYTRDVPASAFHGDTAVASFSLDKLVPPHDNESRALGLLVTTVGFEAK